MTKVRKMRTNVRDRKRQRVILSQSMPQILPCWFCWLGLCWAHLHPDHSSDSLVTDWHLKPAVTPVHKTQCCTVTSLYLHDRPLLTPLRCHFCRRLSFKKEEHIWKMNEKYQDLYTIVFKLTFGNNKLHTV